MTKCIGNGKIEPGFSKHEGIDTESIQQKMG